jgi:hypothetical protein
MMKSRAMEWKVGVERYFFGVVCKALKLGRAFLFLHIADLILVVTLATLFIREAKQ